MANKVNEKTMDLIRHYESLHDGDLSVVGLQPKADPVGIWTSGWGRALIDPLTKKFIRGAENKKRAYEVNTIHTIEDANLALFYDLKSYQLEVDRALKSIGATVNDDQHGALVSMCYNAGGAAMAKTLARIVDKPYDVVQAAFGRYCKGTINGKLTVLRGLVFRRKTEAHLFSTGELVFYNK